MKHKQKSANCLSRRELLKYGLYGSLAAGLSPSLLLSGCGKQRNAKKPNIILITLDTTRADRLGCYGYRRRTSPNLDKLAEESVLYTRAIAPSSWTLPSHASLFTGKFTSSHGA
ncbi:MAG: sulfatase-like hydrolase/transferase, partial [Oceanicoccus sp.]|uniref:sulfatase-like hydrolase/transferase n=1 Tax=Oceanicoccus sp. TaxID=2691044 RepID=UPI002627F9F6